MKKTKFHMKIIIGIFIFLNKIDEYCLSLPLDSMTENLAKMFACSLPVLPDDQIITSTTICLRCFFGVPVRRIFLVGVFFFNFFFFSALIFQLSFRGQQFVCECLTDHTSHSFSQSANLRDYTTH